MLHSILGGESPLKIKLKELNYYKFAIINMRKRHRFTISLGDNCPYCSIGRIVVKTGKYGRFFACDRYPGCVFAQPAEDEDNELDKAADYFLADHGVLIPRS